MSTDTTFRYACSLVVTFFIERSWVFSCVFLLTYKQLSCFTEIDRIIETIVEWWNNRYFLVTSVINISFEIYGTRHVLRQFAIQFQFCCLGHL